MLRCDRCWRRRAFRRLPLLALTGPSGAGKSTVGPALVANLAERLVLAEQDVLWHPELAEDEPGHPRFRRTWLRMAAMLHQSGRPVLLCGTVVPPEFEPLPERALFSGIHYCALTAENTVLARRLRDRPAWRQWDEPRIAETCAFNDWLRAEAATMDPPVRLLDTTTAPLEETVCAVTAWARAVLGEKTLRTTGM